jgi:hypothetical protein
MCVRPQMSHHPHTHTRARARIHTHYIHILFFITVETKWSHLSISISISIPIPITHTRDNHVYMCMVWQGRSQTPGERSWDGEIIMSHFTLLTYFMSSL